MPVPDFDEREWPLVNVRYAAIMTSDEAEEYHRRIGACLARREVFAILADARLAEVPSASERMRMASFISQTSDVSSRYVAGMALVVKTAAGRGVLTAVEWLYPPPFPLKAFATSEEARAWLLERLQEFDRERPSTRRGSP